MGNEQLSFSVVCEKQSYKHKATTTVKCGTTAGLKLLNSHDVSGPVSGLKVIQSVYYTRNVNKGGFMLLYEGFPLQPPHPHPTLCSYSVDIFGLISQKTKPNHENGGY